jgi:hypothetical protein
MMEVPPIDPLFIPIVAILMPLALVPMILILKHRHSRREWEHKVRMKAMEIQMPVAPSQRHGRGTGIAAIGAGVPIASVVAALLASTTIEESSIPQDTVAIHAIIWGCAFLISICAFVTSVVIALVSRKPASETTSVEQPMDVKPAFDPDAYDVVSSRA